MGRLIRILLLAVAAWLIFRLIRQWLASNTGESPTHKPTAATNGQMVRCEHCGIYLPATEAVTVRGRAYCSLDHANLDHAKEGSDPGR